LDSHDKWFFWAAGTVFLVTAKWFGRELSNGLSEPDDTPQQIAFHRRWSVLCFGFAGVMLIAYGVWLTVG
jgi:hypothetical protein